MNLSKNLQRKKAVEVHAIDVVCHDNLTEKLVFSPTSKCMASLLTLKTYKIPEVLLSLKQKRKIGQV